MRWWGPAGFTSPVAEMDVRQGGQSLVCMRAPAEFGGGDSFHTWTYATVVPNERLEFVQTFTDGKRNPVEPADLGLPAGIPRDVPHVVTFPRPRRWPHGADGHRVRLHRPGHRRAFARRHGAVPRQADAGRGEPDADRISPGLNLGARRRPARGAAWRPRPWRARDPSPASTRSACRRACRPPDRSASAGRHW
jgi:hypothetical protein